MCHDPSSQFDSVDAPVQSGLDVRRSVWGSDRTRLLTSVTLTVHYLAEPWWSPIHGGEKYYVYCKYL